MRQATKEGYVTKLKSLGAVLPCSRCGKEKFHLVDDSELGITRNSLSGEYLPVIIVLCINCGNASLHATRILDGVLEEELEET